MMKRNIRLFAKLVLISVLFLPFSSYAAGPELPKDIKWLTNDSDPVFASPEAKRGGTLHAAIMSFPMTYRFVGPDSNGSFRSAILDNHLSLIGIHPNTLNIIPELATHWAFGKDKKTMYFRLNRKALLKLIALLSSL